MAKVRNRASVCLATIIRHLIRLRADQRGNVAIMMAFLMVPVIGAMGLGFEVSNWYLTKRAMQNATDAAVIAAAGNGGSNYDVEAKAVVAQYGFVNGSDKVTVTVSNKAVCPDAADVADGNTCYSVTITKCVPLYLSKVVRFKGDCT